MAKPRYRGGMHPATRSQAERVMSSWASSEDKRRIMDNADFEAPTAINPQCSTYRMGSSYWSRKME